MGNGNGQDERDRFNGIGEQLAGGSDADAAEEDEDQADENDDVGPTQDPALGTKTDDPATADNSGSAGPDADQDAGEQEPTDPPFGFDAVSQRSYYTTDATFDPVSQNRTVVRLVCAQNGVPEDNLTNRELHDAELAVLQELPNWRARVAQEVLERRGVDIDEDRLEETIDFLSE